MDRCRFDVWGSGKSLSQCEIWKAMTRNKCKIAINQCGNAVNMLTSCKQLKTKCGNARGCVATPAAAAIDPTASGQKRTLGIFDLSHVHVDSDDH